MRILAILDVDQNGVEYAKNHGMEGFDYCRQKLSQLESDGIRAKSCAEIPPDTQMQTITNHLIDTLAKDTLEEYSEALELLGE